MFGDNLKIKPKPKPQEDQPEVKFPVLMVAGFASLPDDFSKGMPDFDALLARLVVDGRSGVHLTAIPNSSPPTTPIAPTSNDAAAPPTPAPSPPAQPSTPAALDGAATPMETPSAAPSNAERATPAAAQPKP